MIERDMRVTRALFTDLVVIEIRPVGKIKAFACRHSSREWIPDVNSEECSIPKVEFGACF